MKFKGTE